MVKAAFAILHMNNKFDYIYDNRLYDKQHNNIIQTIVVNIIDKCNYNCSYCYNSYPRTNISINLNSLLLFLVKFHDIFQKKIELLLLGGEPTLHNDLYVFCYNMSKYDWISIRIFSNLSANVSYIKSLIQLRNVSFNFTWHTINGQHNYEFIDKINVIFNDINHINLNEIVIMYEQEYCEYAINVFYKLADLYAKHINFTFVHDAGNTRPYNYMYTTEQLKMYDNCMQYMNYKSMRRSIDSLICEKNNTIFYKVSTDFDDPRNKLSNFKYYRCNAGLDQLYIHFNGDISPCEDLYIQKNIIISNINQKLINFNKMKYQLCLLDNCPCPYFSLKSKVFK